MRSDMSPQSLYILGYPTADLDGRSRHVGIPVRNQESRNITNFLRLCPTTQHGLRGEGVPEIVGSHISDLCHRFGTGHPRIGGCHARANIVNSNIVRAEISRHQFVEPDKRRVRNGGG